jgi:Ca-activated chloride channel family protein
MIRLLIGAVLWAALALALVPGQAGAAVLPDDQGLAGRITAEAAGKTIQFPSLKTDVVADIQGDLATVTVTQTFVNPTVTALNAKYLFPLHKDAAVFAMTMEAGDEIVQAKIREREEARQTFEQGKREGKAAALLEQHRPNMFTQEIANLMPGDPIKVTLKYTQTVPRIDGAYELNVPLVVGPRYIPADRTDRPQVAAVLPTTAPRDNPAADSAVPRIDAPSTAAPPAAGLWQLGPVPSYPEVAGLTIPATVDTDRVSIRVNLASGMPITGVTSMTHALATTGDATSRTVTLAEGRIVDNRDFILRYTLSGAVPQAGLLAHRDARGGIFSLLIEPPQAPAGADITPREMVFVLDTSGSMSGLPIEASKTFMRHALKALRPADCFRIIRFSNNASEFTSGPVPATAANVRAGLAYVDGLSADGGTEVLAGLSQAYGVAKSSGTLRIVVFLSDGYVGNEPEILRMVAASVGQGRLYAFGIGSAVNRYLIEEMARHGRGLSRVIDPTEKSHEAAIQFASRLKTPVLTDIQIDWGSLKPQDVTPALVPDLFDGDSIRIQGRFETAGTHLVKVSGKVNGRPALLPLQIEVPAGATGAATEAIPLIWARSRISDHMHALMVPPALRTSGLAETAVKAAVTDLGLKYSLVTQWTSFVAVSERKVNLDPASNRSADVPLPMVEGVKPSAYPDAARQPGLGGSRIIPSIPAAGGQMIEARAPVVPSSQPSFTGGAAPEPEHLAGLALVAFLLLWRLRRLSRMAA